MDASIFPFPLEHVRDVHLQKLCQILWRWNLCDLCMSGRLCGSSGCPWRRWKRLSLFFQFYRACTASYIPELQFDNNLALSAHEDLQSIMSLLYNKRSSPRKILMEEYFLLRGGGLQPAESDQHRAFDLAFKVMTMVACSGKNQSADVFDAGSEPIVWRDGDSLEQFFESAFPTRDHPTLNEKDDAGIGIKSQLKASQLRNIAGLKFRGTDHLKDHLRMNQETGIVDFYHHTSVLKEHLGNPQRSVLSPISVAMVPRGMTSGLRSHISSSIVPRQLVLETIDSLQMIIFPMDRESRRILRSLVSKQNLDPDCLRFERIDRTEDEKDIKYQYWASRLMNLYDEVENPKPRGLLGLWMERKSGARYVMMATLAGVVIAVVLGLLGLIVGIFQAWVGYQQWQHPISST